MRKCIRCGEEMVENCDIKTSWWEDKLKIINLYNQTYKSKIGKPKVAVCPSCGEVSFYIKDVFKFIKK